MFLKMQVNENTRRMVFEDSKSTAGIVGDSNVDGVVFYLPEDSEYFEFRNAVVYVIFFDATNKSHMQLLDQVDDYSGMPKWTFDDNVLKNDATSRVPFFLHMVISDTSGTVLKSWNTLPSTVIVYKNRDYDNQEEEATRETDIDRLAGLVTTLTEKAKTLGDVKKVLSQITGSAPKPVDTRAKMIDDGHIYVYTGDETSFTTGALYYYVDGTLTYGGIYGSYDLDTTLTESGKAADAGAVGAAIAEVKEDLSTKTGLSEEAKQALLACFAKVAWVDEHGQNYYDALEDALYPPADISRIEATYSAKGMPLEGDSTDTLKSSIAVTAIYTDGTSQTVEGYALTSTLLTSGVNSLLVSYAGKTTNVDVTALSTDLPSGFQRVEYIENDASAISTHDVETSAFIDLGLYFANNTDEKEYLVDYERTSIATDTRYIMACGLSDNNKFSVGFAVGLNPSTELIYAYSGSTAVVPDSYLLNNRYKIYSKLTSGNIYVEDKNTGSGGNAEGETRDCYNRMITLFAQGNGQTTASTKAKYAISGRIYSAQVLQGSTLKACLIPCRNISTSAIGVYDIVRNRFIEPKSSATFSVGADV